jgi:uncharacterized protein
MEVWVRFYEELNDFLPAVYRKQNFPRQVKSKCSVKDLIESHGVPHTEVDLILVNGISVDFRYQVQPDDRISVFPVFESLDISSVTRLRPTPLRVTRFVLDVHLGKLACLLRLAGFDTLYRNDYDDPELAAISRDESRILLTRDRNILKRNAVTHGYYIRNTDPENQFREVAGRFDLQIQAAPFTRCMRCNGCISTVSKDAVRHLIEPRTDKYFSEFKQCRDCARVYWKGSHYAKLEAIVSQGLGEI